MISADLNLARRIEAAEAANARGCIGQADSAVLEIAGGCAIFVGVDSPLTQVVGIGLNGPVTAGEVDEIEAFFRSRNTRIAIDLCPLADATLLNLLSTRGYSPTEFNNVLVKRLTGTQIVETPRVRRAVTGECESWSYAVGRGFFEQVDLTADEIDVGRAIFAMPGALCYLSIVDCMTPVGGGALTVRDGLATLFADSSIKPYRRRGLHHELIAARLNEALAQGADTATASTLPGSASQRNYERHGFQVAYTKVTLVAR